MKKAFQNSLSLLMAVIVLFSTFSFTVDAHYCGKFLVDKAVFSKAKTCGMEQVAGGDSYSEDSCCSNEKTAVKGQDELKNSFHSLDLDQQVFLTSFTYSYLDLFESLPREVVPFKDYSPPLLVTDIQLVDQVFLI